MTTTEVKAIVWPQKPASEGWLIKEVDGIYWVWRVGDDDPWADCATKEEVVDAILADMTYWQIAEEYREWFNRIAETYGTPKSLVSEIVHNAGRGLEA